MLFSSVLCVAFLPLLVVALPSTAQTRPAKRQSCPKGAFVIATRGHNEEVDDNDGIGYGLLGSTTNLILGNISSSVSHSTNYPNGNEDVPEGVAVGVKMLKRRIVSTVNRCPRARIILLGYSEGAIVTMNTICGTSSSGYNPTRPLADKFNKHIAAVMVYADVTYVAGEPYNVGTCKKDGMNARSEPAACNPYRNRIQSYCDSNDVYCCSGKSHDVHGRYAGKYNDAAVKFVVKKYKQLVKRQAKKSW